MRHEQHNMHGDGYRDHEVYDMPSRDEHDYWASVTDVPCPVDGCGHMVLWYEAGGTPGYRACMREIGAGQYDHDSLRHRFFARGNAAAPTLVRDDCCER